MGSPPSRGRGLKPINFDQNPVDICVAPFAGAWIETGINEGMMANLRCILVKNKKHRARGRPKISLIVATVCLIHR